MQHTAHDDEIALLREAVALLDGSGEPLERARAHADLGGALRRAGHTVEARDPLRLAVDLAHRCDAIALEERALAELRAAGGRPRRPVLTGPGALTRSERRIADLASVGHRNREIAEVLVVTLATVEYHLRNAYRKLGITSRTQLSDALRADPAHTPAKVSVRILGGRATALPTATGFSSCPSGARVRLSMIASRARWAPISDALCSRWDCRSRAATATF
jgi:DNA-binding CsgD family transcriptional regulator